MNAEDVLMYGSKTFLDTLERFPKDKVNEPNACGMWSVKDVVAHMASEEEVLVEVLKGLVGESGPTPLLDEMAQGAKEFNVREVEKRKGKGFDELVGEYKQAHDQVMELIRKISEEKRRKVGTLPWYGEHYSLEDYLVYGYYGHDREHSIHVAAFADVLARS